MNAELRDKWIGALRSGTYTQGRGLLRLGDKFCASGVLLDVMGGGRWVTFVSNDLTLTGYVVDSGQPGCCYAFLPPGIVDKAVENYITKINDEGKPFEEIAEWIELNL